MSILWYVIWEIFVYESPAVHPTISENERNYIEESIADSKIEVIACLIVNIYPLKAFILRYIDCFDNVSE